MTDKQTFDNGKLKVESGKFIVDGCDVSGCEFIADTNKGLIKCTSWVHNNKKEVSGHWDCRENKNCYYKRLKDAEKTVEECHKYQAKLEDEIERLEQENKLFRQAHKTEQDRRRNLERVLDEIKDIAVILAPMTDEYDNCYYKDRCSKCEVKVDCQYFKVEQILQKISEVTND